MKIGTAVQAILRFFLSHFKGCNVGITDGRDLYAVEIVSGTMIYTPSFIKIGSSIYKLIRVIHMQTQRHTHRHQGDLISILLFFAK
jgi:hypothetical protein